MIETYKDNDLAIYKTMSIVFFCILFHVFLFLLALLVCLTGTGNAGRMC